MRDARLGKAASGQVSCKLLDDLGNHASADGAARVQANCMSCHARLAMLLRDNSDSYHDFHGIADGDDVRCWSCHRDVPHGRVRGLTATPYNLGVRELQ